MSSKRLCAAILSVAATAAPAYAGDDLTPPAWREAISTLAASFSSESDRALRLDFGDRAVLRTLEGQESSPGDLAVLAARADWSCALAYYTTPSTLARDISDALQDAPIPEGARAYFTPSDDGAMRRADITAMKWVANRLKSRVEQPVGVVLLHIPGAQGPAEGVRDPGKLVVILLAGEQSGRDRYRFRQVVFGAFELKGK